ncbi:MAG: response regulator [Treponema sp.]|jgi:signal transduction histidine kinase/HPt (histidine-containing phosphotransfer) domain-containing protein/FixJ family two-component response regulator|nr:response regulator [Treponema sp.]
MDFKKILHENFKQLLFIFFAFLLMIVLSCVFTGITMGRFLADSSALVLESGEDKMRLKFQEIEISLVNVSITVNQMNESGVPFSEIQNYLTDFGNYARLTPDILPDFQNIVGIIGGNFVCDETRQLSETFDPYQQPWYQILLDNPFRVAFTAPYYDTYSNSMVFAAAILLRESDRGVYGMLAMEMNVRSLTKFAGSLHVIAGGYGMLLTPDMTIVAHRYDEMIGVKFVDVDPHFQEVSRSLISGDGSIIATEYNRPYGVMVAFFRRMDTNWFIGIATPKESYYRTLYMMILFMALLGVGMMLVLAYFLIRLAMAKMHSDDENKAKSSFLARVSHEIRTPMNSILGMSEIIMRKNISEEIYEYISTIRQSGATLLSIINDILDFSRIESGKVEVESKPYSISSLINDVVNVIRIRLMDKPIDFFVNMDRHIPAELIGDEVRIRQILINLLNNAVKYTQEGYIFLDMRVEPLEANRVRLIVRVQDSGIGIRNEDKGRLFSDFTRVDLENNLHVEGAGLGLSITKTLCTLMGGDIGVESEYGTGSVFTARVIQSYQNDQEAAVVKSSKTLRVLFFEERPRFAAHFLDAMNNLGVITEQSPTFDDFIASLTGDGLGKRCDYAFVSSRYADRSILAWRQAMSTIKLIIMIEIGDISGYRNVGSVHLPVYSTILANLLNGDVNVNHNLYDFRIRITAPDAKTLIVDDIATNLRVAAELMSPYGLKIDTCLSGIRAIEMIKQNKYDIVFMDHMMPEMDGIAATGVIRAMGDNDPYYRKLPIIMLTANAVSGQREMFLENGIDDFLPKPIEVRHLNDILEKWIPKVKQKKSSSPVLWDFEEDRSLLSINGVNAQTGLRNAGDSLKAYKKVLAVFVDDADERIPQIEAALSKSNLSLYTTLVHAIKGASRSIGADYIGELAAELEEAGHAGNMIMIREKTGIFLEKLQILRDSIADTIDSSDQEDGESKTETAFSTLDLEGLREALVGMDTELVNKKLAEYGEVTLQKQVRSYIDGIEQDVLLFEYDKAIEKIDALLNGNKGEDK